MRTPFTRHQKFQNPKPSSSVMSRRAFQLRVDPLTGTSEWVVVEDGPSDETPCWNSPKSLLANTSYLDMLNDSSRNSAFHHAIKTTVAGPSRVLDIGAGTGLLSMMAVRAMEQNGGGGGTVTAFESYLPMGKLLRKVLRANGLENRVTVVHKRSDEVEVGVDIDRRANVLVSEILDSELLGEGLIPTLQHAHDVLLVENPQTVPFRATIYGQLVESTFLWKLHDLYSCEVEASDEIHLAPSQQDIQISVGLKQHAMHCSPLLKEIKLLSEPFEIFEFKFSRRPASQRTVDLDIKTSNEGTAHAIVSWWVLQLDSTGSVFYSTSPQWSLSCDSAAESKNWCDHWKQCVWFIPGNGIPVSRGGSAACEAIQDITSISFRMKNNTNAEMPTLAVRDSQILLPPERIGIYGDKCWRRSFITAARNALKQKDSPFCLITDDSLFLSIAIAHLSKTAHIVSAFPGFQEKASLYLESVASENDFSNGRIQVLGRKASCLTADDFCGRKIDLYIAEPFYYGNEGALPWQNLRFWKERTLVDPFLSEGALIMPSKGLLKACAMSLPDLWKSRRSLKKIEGFDHSSLDEILGACGDIPATSEGPCLPYFVWQCGIVEKLSEVFCIMEFDFSKLIHPCFERTTITFTKPGVCHGFVLWIDWVIDEKNSILISTGPDSRYWKQGVKLLRKPFAVNAPSSCGLNELGSSEIETSFDPSSGELDVLCHT